MVVELEAYGLGAELTCRVETAFIYLRCDGGAFYVSQSHRFLECCQEQFGGAQWLAMSIPRSAFSKNRRRWLNVSTH